MQPQTIRLQKSRLRVVGFGIGGAVMTVVAVTSIVRALHANGDTHLITAMVGGALIGGTSMVFSFATAFRSIGTLTVEGDQMIERTGVGPFGRSQQIAISQVARVEATGSAHTVGVTQTGTKVKAEAKILLLSTTAGATFSLDPESYQPDQRVKLAPVIMRLLEDEKVVKVGPVEQVLAVWYTADPVSHTISEPTLGTTGESIKVQRKHTKRILLFLGLFFLGLFIFLGVVGTQRNALCDAIVSSHQSVTAQVTQISLDKAKQYKYDDETTIDISKASGVNLYITYEVDGKEYSKHTNIEYINHSDVEQLYDQASTGQLDLVYPTGHPDTVRPASEFSPDISSDTLCKNAL